MADRKQNQQICPVQKRCGGCQYLGISNQEQLKKKEQMVKKQLKGVCEVDSIIGMEEPWRYRNKVHGAFASVKGTIISGTYEESTHRVVPVEDCLIEDEKADAVIRTIRNLLKSFKVRVYDERTGYGLLRRVLIRRGFATNQILVVLVCASPVFPSKNNFVKALRKEHPEITSVVLNINDKYTSMILGERNITLYGKGYIEDILCGKTFRISPASFYQVNPVQTEKLYRKAIELAGLTGKERIIDAYCGIGTIGQIAADHCKEVIGVELNKTAVADARINAKINGVKNTRYFAADAGAFMVQMAERKEHADVLFMDPPRAGSDLPFIQSAVKLGPDKIVYISCNPETLARDLKIFKKKGYIPGTATPVDLFPWTSHVETVVLLSKGIIDSQKVKVEVSLEDMDMSGFKKGATYEAIKDYVKEQTGYKVSSLYIAQVKAKHGLDMRENFNLPKSEDARQPKCPAEKEKAIEDALRHFQMI